MKTILFLFLCLGCLASKAQGEQQLRQIDSVVEKIDASATKFDTCKGPLRDVYFFSLENGRLSKIITQYQHGGSFFTETFYLSDTTMVFCLRSEAPGYLSNYKPVADKRIYFKGEELLYVQTPGSTTAESFTAEINGIVSRLNKAKRGIQWCLKRRKY